MPPTAVASLGEFELLVLLATLSLGDAAYPVSIAADIESRTGRKASRTAVLVTLERLEDKGLLTSRYGDPTRVTPNDFDVTGMNFSRGSGGPRPRRSILCRR